MRRCAHLGRHLSPAPRADAFISAPSCSHMTRPQPWPRSWPQCHGVPSISPPCPSAPAAPTLPISVPDFLQQVALLPLSPPIFARGWRWLPSLVQRERRVHAHSHPHMHVHTRSFPRVASETLSPAPVIASLSVKAAATLLCVGGRYKYLYKLYARLGTLGFIGWDVGVGSAFVPNGVQKWWLLFSSSWCL